MIIERGSNSVSYTYNADGLIRYYHYSEIGRKDFFRP